MDNSRADTALSPSVGIVWGVRDGAGPLLLVTDCTPLAEAEAYGDALTHAAGHCDVWDGWRRLGPAGLARRGLPALICWHEYEHFPRGRVVFDTTTRRFTLYAHRALQKPGTVRKVLRAFGLDPAGCAVRSDPHYRTGNLPSTRNACTQASLSWLSLRPEPWSRASATPHQAAQSSLRLPGPLRGISCVAFGVGDSGAAWITRLASSAWFSGLEPQPEDLAAAGAACPAGRLVLRAGTPSHMADEAHRAVARIALPSAPVAAVAVPCGVTSAELDATLGLVAALRARRDAHGCRMAAVVTLEAPLARNSAFGRALLGHGAFVVRAGLGAEGGHVHHYPLRAATEPRRGRLVCVDLADYLACWRPGTCADLHVIPGTPTSARDAIGRLAFRGARALTLDLHLGQDGTRNDLVILDELGSHCRDRFGIGPDEGFIYTSAERLDSRTGTADLLVTPGRTFQP